jgi:hypothetical protein
MLRAPIVAARIGRAPNPYEPMGRLSKGMGKAGYPGDDEVPWFSEYRTIRTGEPSCWPSSRLRSSESYFALAASSIAERQNPVAAHSLLAEFSFATLRSGR